MKVMLTGGTGFIGGHLLKALTSEGHDVRLLVRDAEKLERMIELQSIEAEVDYVIGDMADPATVQASLEGCNACIHAAAFTSLDPSQMDQALAVNGPAAQLILDTAHQQGCDPIIHISTM